VAIAQIATPVQVVEPDPTTTAFARTLQKFEGAQPRVTLRVDEVIDPPLSRQVIKNNPALAGLSIFRMAQGSNFPITEDERQALDSLLRVDAMEALVAYTLLERSFLEEIVSALTQPVDAGGSPQIILAGPPGTSKTWVAEAIARYISESISRVRLVQFHPNYSYEAFVEGLRPHAEGGAITFQQQNGVLLSLVDEMRRVGETNAASPLYSLIVDEMNRANLPRVFGELMYLFEYRNKTIRLQYSEEFALPPNLRFIGTMNTADRSIRSIDIALRRRFDVFELKPDAGVLRRFFERNPLSTPNLISGFEKLNEKLDSDLDRHHTIGHAFFMRPRLDRKMLRAIWDRKIYPLIEEYFFDQLDIARKEYVFEAFWPE
jgi:5-methylcytosine-specific restriction enzyme B